MVHAGQSEDGGDVTEEVVQDVGTTERDAGDKVDLDPGDGEALTKEKATNWTHSPVVAVACVRRVADGHVAVVGHGGQEHTRCTPERLKK